MPALKILGKLTLFFSTLYILVCTLVYYNQESLLFHPVSLRKSYRFQFSAVPSEVKIPVENATLNGLYFTADSSKGTVFFLHGNAGNLTDLEGPMSYFVSQGYDFFAFDYRGFGKSSGTIESEEQFYEDAQSAYSYVQKKFQPKTTVIAGYSVGCAAAAKLASENSAGKLLLMAPYFSMTELAADHYPFVPSFLVKYAFETHLFIRRTKEPVLIFHGKNDGTIPSSCSGRLLKLRPEGAKLFLLENTGHNDIIQQEKFRTEAAVFLDD